VAKSARNALPDGCRVLDDVLADGRPFVAGERPTIADCILAASLQFGRFGGVGVDPSFANLLRWDRAYRERPAVKELLPL
jgi:glutathione S-transferase